MNTNSATTEAAGIPQPPVLHITPPSRWWVLPFGELWDYRELLYFFVWRDIKIRYKQTAVGAAWAVIQPFLTMLVFSLFFGRASAHSFRRASLPYFLLQRLVALDVFRGQLAKRHEHDRRKPARRSPRSISRGWCCRFRRPYQDSWISAFRF